MACEVWVIDTSSIVQIKHDVPLNKQWDLLRGMEGLVEGGRLAFPSEVAREAKALLHPDAPGTWAGGVDSKVQFDMDPTDETMRDVMSLAGDVVDPDKQLDGDPYVLGQALELSRAGPRVCVVTEDVRDHGDRISLATACDRLNLEHVRLEEFLKETGLL